MLSLDAKSLSQRDAYKILISSIVPRPIAFVSTVSAAGVTNLAPFSFFNGVSSNPLCLMFSVTRKPDGDKKDTLKNIEATRQFVVNTVSEGMADRVNQASAEYPYGVSEFEKAGFTPVPSLLVRPPRVSESLVQMECELYKLVEVGEGGVGSAVVIIGQIVQFHLHESAYKDGAVLFDVLKPLSRLGGLNWGHAPETFELPRPKT